MSNIKVRTWDEIASQIGDGPLAEQRVAEAQLSAVDRFVYFYDEFGPLGKEHLKCFRAALDEAFEAGRRAGLEEFNVADPREAEELENGEYGEEY